MERKKTITKNYLQLTLTSAAVAFASAVLGFSLMHLTDFFEHAIFTSVVNIHPALLIFLPTIGITSIYFLRKYLFKNRKNKGITEIYKTLDQRKDHLPLFKIPSHFLNGFLTVIFGGSTGVEVSTVVATATIGNAAYERKGSANRYKRELICAGVTAGVAILFTSPLAGWLFSIEVIARRWNKTLAISCTIAALVSWLFMVWVDHKPLLSLTVKEWNWYAIPFFVVLSLLGGILSVYFTLLVTRMKSWFSKITNNFIRVNTGALLVGLLLFIFPALYGDSYHGLISTLTDVEHTRTLSLFVLAALVLLKPLAAALTLGAGGDGGVFAPSIVCGSFLGLLFAIFCNTYFDTQLLPLNFALAGAAATLSASLYAPFTSLVLVCSLLPNGYHLFAPLLLSCYVSLFFAKRLLPYNVYTHHLYVNSNS